MLRRGGCYKVRNPRTALYTLVFFCIVGTLLRLRFGNPFWPAPQVHDEWYIRRSYPLAYKHIYQASGAGGAWYIPPQWTSPSDSVPKNILEAAHLAHRLAKDKHTIPYSEIPLIVHQTWGNTNVTKWGPNLLDGVERWLTYATQQNPGMAYFMWLDDGCENLMKETEPGILAGYNLLPLPVEKSDVFRIVVVNSIGGIYGDIDTMPLKNPHSWLSKSDSLPWEDQVTGAQYGKIYKPTRLLIGLEADNEPDTDIYWRMGYNYPQQLCQWALASAPQHPALDLFVSKLNSRLKDLARLNGGSNTAAFQKALKKEDPIGLTGPGAVTAATMEYLNQTAGLRWPALSGLHDDGQSKVVGDTMVLAITAFSPGRGSWRNMGSRPITDPSARLIHVAQGSWRKKTLKVEMGKLCKTVLGMCKDWSRVPDE